MRSARSILGTIGPVSAFLVLFAAIPNPVVAGDEAPTFSPFRLFERPISNRTSSTPHPAVVRVSADEGKSLASGSGSYVAARGQYGLVVTNWHVVRDAKGNIDVTFPDGFRSSGTVLGTDKDWDLAALLIWRPKVAAIKVSNTAPQPGDTLTIAGYGQGDYLAATGKCTQYVAPSTSHPYEIVELSAQARQGDSGGPIFNAQGELAGVLFGASRGSTSGSYCGRVRWFLTSVWPDFDAGDDASSSTSPLVAFDPANPSIPAASHPSTPPTAPPMFSNPLKENDVVPIANDPVAVTNANPESNVNAAESSANESYFEPDESLPRDRDLIVTNTPPPELNSANDKPTLWESVAGKSRMEQAKTIFAIIGILAVWGQVTRWMGR